MYWIALKPTHDDDQVAWGFRALRYTPRVAHVDEAILMEASASLRLWGGRKPLLQSLFGQSQAMQPAVWAQARTAVTALALLRLKLRGEALPEKVPHSLPLDVMTAAIEHVPTLERIGCTTWGQANALPRSGVARRFGKEILASLDAAFASRNETFSWLQLPESFDLKYELVALATTAPELMWGGQRLLGDMQQWLQARNQGVLALELEWTLDLKRLNGVKLPQRQQLVVRTAEPTQDVAHLRRLVSEHLARATLAAPVSWLRLRSVETVPWGGACKSLLPEDNVKGERLHQFIERLSVRLGEGNVAMAAPHADHRPEAMQQWQPARGNVAQPFDDAACDALYPTWVLPEPMALEVKRHVPHYGGPLRRLTRLYRIETGWWEGGRAALRDYFIARSESAGLVWIYRERPQQLATSEGQGQDYRWYLQGLYA